MVTGTRIDGGAGGTTVQMIVSSGVQKTIKSIKEIVGNHSDADIYHALKETNMDPNESVHKLLHQDTFHEVKRRKDKKKEKVVVNDSPQPRKNFDDEGQMIKKNTFSDRNGRRGGNTRSSFAVAGRGSEFQAKDNKLSQNTDRETKPTPQQSVTSVSQSVTSNIPEKGSTGTSNIQKPFGRQNLSRHLNVVTDSGTRPVREANTGDRAPKELSEKPKAVSNPTPRREIMKPNDHRHSAKPTSSNFLPGVQSSSSDPVHVPSLDSRSSASIRAIRREVGVVGVRKQSAETFKHSFVSGGKAFPNSVMENDKSSFEELVRPSSSSISKGNQLSHTPSPDSMPNISASRPLSSNQHGSRPVHQVAGHQKAFQGYKKWKPKSSNKSSGNNVVVVGLPAIADLQSSDSHENNYEDLTTKEIKVQDKLSQVDISESQNVVIAEHIRVPETERCLLTFGSIGPGFQALGSAEGSGLESTESLAVAAVEPLHDTLNSNQIDTRDGHVASSGSPASDATANHDLPDKNESFSPRDSEGYADVGIVRENSQLYASTEPQVQQQQEASELPSFSTFDPQTGYDIPYFRPTVDESVWAQGMPSPQEALGSYAANGFPASTISMVHQQSSGPHMYPQVHLSHFPNLMPYRQFLPPVYVPQMGVPGYPNNPGYLHPSNGSYVLMPGGNSNTNQGGLKYEIQQFKPLPTGNPTGYGNFTSPTAYTVNAPSVDGAIGFEDSSRLKHKDGNFYVSNPQVETSEIWIQNPREISAVQSAQYYNMATQAPHGAYLPSHNRHPSFNEQSSHMQFPGMYHAPPQPAGLANPHHLAPTMVGNVAMPGQQVGAYQQQQ